MVLEIILFVVTAMTSILFFYYIRKERILHNTIVEAYGALDKASARRIKETKTNIFAQAKGFQRKRNRFIEWPNRLFIYSGLSRIFVGISFEMWSLIILISAAVLYFAVYVLTSEVLKACLFTALYVVLILGIEKLLAVRNYRVVDNNLIKFLNIFENFNATNGEIMSILLQTSRFLPDPLSTVLEECYYDAQTCGDKTLALYAMADKIEHPKFKEIICNIEICEKYTADYAITLGQSRKIIMEEQRQMRERKEIARSQSLIMLLISFFLVVALVITDGLIEKSIWEIMFHSTFGHIFLAVIMCIYLYFFYKMLMAER